MIAIISLFIVLMLSMLVVRVSTVALTLTGLSRDLARFQSLSAFTGVGFTTSESEYVSQHPVRRRIISVVMLLGHAGVVAAISSLILSFLGSGGTREGILRFGLLLLGAGALLAVATSRWIDRRMSRVIAWALRRWTRLEIRDYAGLLHLFDEYTVREMEVEKEGWVAGKKLSELCLPEEGTMVLGIQRADGSYIGAPRGASRIYEGDVMILYGRAGSLGELGSRPCGEKGDLAHQEAVAGHRHIVLEQQQREESQETKWQKRQRQDKEDEK